MGLIKAALGSVGGVMADQWKEYFYCEAMPENVMAVKGQKRVSGRSSNTKGSDNVISNGSVIAVADGQCMMIVDQGRIIEVCAEPGEFTYDMSTEPSLFTGELKGSIRAVIDSMTNRFTFGGEAPKDQRVYYFNTKELMGNKYGTPSPVPFRVVDQRAGIDIDVGIRCFGEYSYHITNPVLFYTNVCGNVSEAYTRDKLDSQLKTELLTALQPAFARIGENGIRYSQLPGHTMELADALNEVLSKKWRDLRGIESVSFGVSSEGAAAQRGLHGSHPRGGASRRLSGRCHEDGGQQSGRRGHGVYGHEHGRSGRRHERPEPVRHGSAAGGSAARPAGRSCQRLDLRLRSQRQYRQVLCRMRPAQARSRRGVEVRLRRGEHRQILL